MAASEPWPASTIEQISAIQMLIARRPTTPEEATRHFAGARQETVSRHLETLALMGEVQALEGGEYEAIRQLS